MKLFDRIISKLGDRDKKVLIEIVRGRKDHDKAAIYNLQRLSLVILKKRYASKSPDLAMKIMSKYIPRDQVKVEPTFQGRNVARVLRR